MPAAPRSPVPGAVSILRPQGEGAQVAGGGGGVGPAVPAGLPRRPGGARQQLLALPGGAESGARLGPPPHPGRDPGALSRGSRRVPGDTERRREGRGARLCQRSPSGGTGHAAPAPLCPRVRAGRQRDLSRGRSPPGAGARTGAGSAPRPADRDAGCAGSRSREEQWPCGSQAASPAHPGLPSGMLDLRPCRRPRPPSLPACGAPPLWDCTEAWEG